MAYHIHIKNMVCPRCIDAVKQIFEEQQVSFSQIMLGEIVVNEDPNPDVKTTLGKALEKKGFELLVDKKGKQISQIKNQVLHYILNQQGHFKVKFSAYLANELNQDYALLSKLFSSVEGITIERYLLKKKIERVKELLFYDELTLSEISYQLDYSSVAHLSGQFKKETGMTPTQFKNERKPGHNSLDKGI